MKAFGYLAVNFRNGRMVTVCHRLACEGLGVALLKHRKDSANCYFDDPEQTMNFLSRSIVYTWDTREVLTC
jgi:hypothetical protein